MSNDELRKYYQYYSECWKIFKDFSTDPAFERIIVNNEDSAEFWERICAKATELYDKYGRPKLLKELLLSTLDEVERISKTAAS